MKGGLTLLLVALLLGAGAYLYTERTATGVPGHQEPEESRAALEPELGRREPQQPPVAPAEEGAAEAPALETLVDGEWSIKNAEAIRALEAGQLELAVALFEACLEGRPDEPVFASNLAEALARLARSLYEAGDGPLIEPITLLERAVALAPQREPLVHLLARWKRSAATEEGFWTDESAHFLLSYDGARRDLLRRGYYQLGEMLESAYDEFGVAFNHYPVGHGDSKIRVVLYLREEFESVTGIGHWAGGVYDGVVRIPVVDFERQKAELERVLRHELVHAFVRSFGGQDVPAWLNEGLAQWHEELSLQARGAKVQSAREKLSGAQLFPLEKLHGSLAAWSDEQAIGRGYAQSLALIDYLGRTYGEFLLYEMLSGCRAGKACEATFADRTGVALGAALEDLGREL